MPTTLTHAALPLLAAWGLGPGRIPPRLAFAGAAVAILPDLDVIGFRLGIEYGAPLGHRGASHSLLVAVALGLLMAPFSRQLRSRWPVTFIFVALSALSHGLTDMLTNGGRGIALWWPFSAERLFAPVRPVEVSAIGFRGIAGGEFLPTVGSEILWLVLPVATLAAFWRWTAGAHIDSPRGRT